MRNTLLILQREYLVRVRTKAFVIFTLFMPVFIAAVMVLPAKLAMKSMGVRRVMVVAADEKLAEAVKSSLNETPAPDGNDTARKSRIAEFDISVNNAPSEELRQQLTERLRKGTLDSFLWLEADAPVTHKAAFYSRNSGDFVEGAVFQRALRVALSQQNLARRGLSAEQIKEALGPADLDMIHIGKAGAEKSNGFGAYMLPLVLMMGIYMTVLIYGIQVMRSVIEEKTSRVVEVLLGSVTPMELMAGKVLGVGAVGLTQLGIWLLTGSLLGGGGALAAGPMLGEMFKDAHVPWMALGSMPVFFVLGYLTYACMYAAIGAMCNSDEESQQLQFPVTLPLILCMVMAMPILRDPGSALGLWMSLVPLTSPIVMFVRVCVSEVPAWQVALSITINIGALYGLIWLSSRIYRVGILMYGKRPNLPEILKWIRYA